VRQAVKRHALALLSAALLPALDVSGTSSGALPDVSVIRTSQRWPRPFNRPADHSLYRPTAHDEDQA
jgi:hypothetical protein